MKVRRVILTDGEGWSRRASVILHRLVAAGLVELERPPQVAAKWARLVQRDPSAAIAEVSDEPNPDPQGTKADLLRTLARKKPATVREWLGERPAGNVGRAVAWLSEKGLVVLPGQRWPTKEGVEAIKAAAPKKPTLDEKAAAGEESHIVVTLEKLEGP